NFFGDSKRRLLRPELCNQAALCEQRACHFPGKRDIRGALKFCRCKRRCASAFGPGLVAAEKIQLPAGKQAKLGKIEDRRLRWEAGKILVSAKRGIRVDRGPECGGGNSRIGAGFTQAFGGDAKAWIVVKRLFDEMRQFRIVKSR